MRRVVVTGIGVITALGTGAEENWKGLLDGRSGIGPVTTFDASSLRTRLAAEAASFDPKALLDRRSARKMTRNEQFAVGAARLAVEDAGLDGGLDAERTAVFAGGSKEVSDLTKLVEAIVASTEDGKFDVAKVGENISLFQPLFYVEGLQGASLFYISAAFGLKGANTYYAGTAEAGLTAIGRAFRTIRRGEADCAIAGGSDDPVWWWALSSFDALGVLTGANDRGPEAFRPFDREADGAVLGEGASFLVLEEYEAARKRGARIHAEVCGYGTAGDAHRLATPHPEGRGLVTALRRALADARTAPEDVSYVAAHGSATPLGDLSEARALRTVFGDRGPGGRGGPATSSVKPATGHLVGGAGALNAAVAAMAVREGAVPPTLNHEWTQAGCEFDWVPGTARKLPVSGALAVARGLEGQNAVLALRSV